MIKIDINKVRQINDLARDLIRHGIAKSMNEAVVMAEKQLSSAAKGTDLPLKSESEEDVQDVTQELESQETPTEPVEASEQTAVAESVEESGALEQSEVVEQTESVESPESQEGSDMIFKTTVAIVNAHSERLTTTEKKIEDLTNQIKMLREEMTRLSKSPVEVLKTEKADEEPEAAQTTFKPQPEPQKTEPNPRSGDFTSDDVDIEKFFYAGPK